MKCDACGKQMTSEKTGSSYVGMTINVDIEQHSKEEKLFIQKQLGKYEPGKDYCICFECWYKALGIKSPLDESKKTEEKKEEKTKKTFVCEGCGKDKCELTVFGVGDIKAPEQCPYDVFTDDNTVFKEKPNEENDGVLVCKYKGRLKMEELDELKHRLKEAFGEKKKVILIDDRFDLINVSFIKIDAKKLRDEVYAECYPLGTWEEYFEKLFTRYTDEINKQLQGKNEVDESKDYYFGCECCIDESDNSSTKINMDTVKIFKKYLDGINLTLPGHHPLCDEHGCFMSCPILERRNAKKPVDDEDVIYKTISELYKKWSDFPYSSNCCMASLKHFIDYVQRKLKKQVDKKGPTRKKPTPISRDKEVLQFLYARLAEKYAENVNVDYMKRFAEIINAL